MAKALARMHWPAETHKSGFVAGRDSQFTAIVGNLAPCEACIRSSRHRERLKIVFFGARTLDPLAEAGQAVRSQVGEPPEDGQPGGV